MVKKFEREGGRIETGALDPLVVKAEQVHCSAPCSNSRISALFSFFDTSKDSLFGPVYSLLRRLGAGREGSKVGRWASFSSY